MLFDTFKGRRVFITGHTGFKGSWLSEWLLSLGAEITGFALPPPTQPSLFDQLDLASRVTHQQGDVRDLGQLRAAIVKAAPEFVFHLAAQPLVRRSYDQPVETYATNVLGTVHLLESLRALSAPCAVVIATTDKCYDNTEQKRPFTEADGLGGRDPYSSSKACAEIVTAAYRHSFFSHRSINRPEIAIATARAGNVLGGGDWAHDRIMPDCVRSLTSGQSICIRNPNAVRPWQHVLESLSGYLTLAAELDLHIAANESKESSPDVRDAFNFGPHPDSERTVSELVTETLKYWPGETVKLAEVSSLHEASCLRLSIGKAANILGWKPIWNFETTVRETVDWYRENHRDKAAMRAFTLSQIEQYTTNARKQSARWAV